MILACPGCHGSYDVSSYGPGQRLRCQCGQIIVVPRDEPLIQVAPTLHCANCGGHLERGRERCPFCDALVDLTGARMTAYCALCLTMSREGARYCSGCGAPIEKKVDAPEASDRKCPRCNVAMRRRSVGRHAPLECPMCCGLFIDGEDLGEMISAQEERIGPEAVQKVGAEGRATVEPVVYLRCPRCAKTMNRVNYGRCSGVIIDQCRDHGYWLDSGELEKIARFVAGGGLLRFYRRQVEDARAEQRHQRISQSMAGAQLPAGRWSNEERSHWGSTGGFLGKLMDLLTG